MHTLTFGQLLPVIRFGAQNCGVDITNRAAVVAYTVPVLKSLGYHAGDAENNALTLAIMMEAM